TLSAAGTATVATGNLTANTTYALVGVATGTGVTPSCSNTATGSAVVTVNALPSATISGTTTICSGSGTNITFSGTANAVVTYTINGGTNQTVTLSAAGTATLATGNLTSNTTYALVGVATGTGVTPSCSNTATGSAVVTVNALPSATISGSTTVNVGATNPNVTFTATAGTAPFVFTYNINGGSNTTLSSNTATGTIAQSTVAPGTFTYNLVSVSDVNGCSSTIAGQSATIVVKPTGVNDNFNTSINTLKNLDVKANDGAAASGATVTIATAPTNGTAIVQANGTINYTPANGFIGTDTFTYALTLNGVTSDPITVTVSVANGAITAVNDAGTQNGTTGGTAITSLLSNDTYNGVANSGVASAANITITQN
ncbi:beta strand repeat-containing protein, partial [Pedobacter miscanthi]